MPSYNESLLFEFWRKKLNEMQSIYLLYFYNTSSNVPTQGPTHCLVVCWTDCAMYGSLILITDSLTPATLKQ